MNENDKLDLILEKIEKLEEKIEDNNKILHGERNAKRLAFLFSLIKWIIITALGILLWSYIQPYYVSLMKTYDSLIETNAQIQKTFKDVNKQKTKIDDLIKDPTKLWKK